MTVLRAVLFDIDGTLLDSNHAHARAWLDALRGDGKNVPLDQVRDRIGKGGDKLLLEMTGIDVESEEGKSITKRRAALFKSFYLPDLAPMKGGRALVEAVRARGLRAVTVTSATKAEIDALLTAAAVLDSMDLVVTSDDAENSKPDPDLVEVALSKLGISRDEAVMIGDTPYDVTAARRAGVACVAVRCGGWEDPDLEGAVHIYDGPADMLAHLDEALTFAKVERAG